MTSQYDRLRKELPELLDAEQVSKLLGIPTEGRRSVAA